MILEGEGVILEGREGHSLVILEGEGVILEGREGHSLVMLEGRGVILEGGARHSLMILEGGARRALLQAIELTLGVAVIVVEAAVQLHTVTAREE